MNPALKIGVYAAVLVVLLAGAFVAGRALLPAPPAEQAAEPGNSTPSPGGHGSDGHGSGTESDSTGSDSTGSEEPGDHGGHTSGGSEAGVRGLSLEQDGFRLTVPSAPDQTGQAGELSFKIMDADGKPVTDFDVSHEKKLHLIVVRTDGTQFRHIHPELADDGTWSVPWQWPAAGSYRMFADFVPSSTGTPTTLGYGFDVSGKVQTEGRPKISKTSTVDGYDLELTGELSAPGESELTVTVTRDGKLVTTLQPYLGAYGHLVILREGDLGYLHVHPEGAEPKPGSTSGPYVGFVAQAPTPSRYLLYFDFQVDGKVRTAEFVLDADPAAGGTAEDDQGSKDDQGGEKEADGHQDDGHGHGSEDQEER